MINDDQKDQIKSHYEIAKELLGLGEIAKAQHELYNRMSVNLYDESINFVATKGSSEKDVALRDLITEVTLKINL